MTVPRSTSRPFIITAPAEIIRDLVCGEQQHNEHCIGWRWHMYEYETDKRMDAVWAELKQMHAERRAREEFQQAAAE